MRGTYETVDNRPALRFERRLAHPIDRVWRAVTEPDELKQWFPNEVEMDLRVGGKMTFTFPEDAYPPMVGEVLELEAPRLFAFTWGEDELRFELESIDGGDGCLLRFTDVLGDREKAARDAAGWETCFEGLEKMLAGGPSETARPYPTEGWRERYERYVADGLPSGAPLPEPASKS
jgi:uncharacterized protein YndB with AHSA1/START domain